MSLYAVQQILSQPQGCRAMIRRTIPPQARVTIISGGIIGCGLTYCEDEIDWLRHTLPVRRTLGFHIEMADPARIARTRPFYNLKGALRGLHTPDDGHIGHRAYAQDVYGLCTEIIQRPNSHAALALNRPRVRDVLAACTDADPSIVEFCWMSAREITIARLSVRTFRMSHAGEFRWDLDMENTGALDIYDALIEAGKTRNIREYTSFAMNTFRLKKTFKGAGELTNKVTHTEADMMRFARSDHANLEIDFDGSNDGEAVLFKEKSSVPSPRNPISQPPKNPRLRLCQTECRHPLHRPRAVRSCLRPRKRATPIRYAMTRFSASSLQKYSKHHGFGARSLRNKIPAGQSATRIGSRQRSETLEQKDHVR
jgi:Aminomethyltransferase folate-binding domain